MPRTSTSTALRARIARLEASFAPAPTEELNPFLHHNIVAEVEQGAARFRAHVSRTAKRWQTAPEDFGPWEGRSPIDKLITAATPEQAEEALQLFERLREEKRAKQSEFDRRRQEQYYAAYEWQRRHQARAE
jgi:hypothetical protein